MAQHSEVGKSASEAAGKKFADELARRTSLTADQAHDLFPTAADRDELEALLEIIDSAADDNSKKAELIKKAGKVGGAVLKIVKKFATGL